MGGNGVLGAWLLLTDLCSFSEVLSKDSSWNRDKYELPKADDSGGGDKEAGLQENSCR